MIWSVELVNSFSNCSEGNPVLAGHVIDLHYAAACIIKIKYLALIYATNVEVRYVNVHTSGFWVACGNACGNFKLLLLLILICILLLIVVVRKVLQSLRIILLFNLTQLNARTILHQLTVRRPLHFFSGFPILAHLPWKSLWEIFARIEAAKIISPRRLFLLLFLQIFPRGISKAD